jgi:GTPase SAR1 family protein
MQIVSDPDETHIQMLKESYLCPYFRILIIGRANAGKTTILEKICGVAKGTKPAIYNKWGKSNWVSKCFP